MNGNSASSPIVATFTFFSKSTCGYCHQFKGDSPGPNGTTVTDPNGHWERLTADQDLKNAGIEFILFKFGPEKDPATGKVVTYGLPEPYASKIRGVPYLELRLPNDVNSGVPFDIAPRDYPTVKKWCLAKLQEEPFKSYAAGVRSGKIPSNGPTQIVEKPSMPVAAPAPSATTTNPARGVARGAPPNTAPQIQQPVAQSKPINQPTNPQRIVPPTQIQQPANTVGSFPPPIKTPASAQAFRMPAQITQQPNQPIRQQPQITQAQVKAESFPAPEQVFRVSGQAQQPSYQPPQPQQIQQPQQQVRQASYQAPQPQQIQPQVQQPQQAVNAGNLTSQAMMRNSTAANNFAPRPEQGRREVAQQEPARPMVNTFGMGTQPTPAPIKAEPEFVAKAPSRFAPKNSE